MPYTITLADAKESVLRNIAGVCADSDQFVEYVNEAQRRLMRRGNWFDAEQVVKLCVYNNCITWPAYVGTVLGVRFCGMDKADIHNNWFKIVGPSTCSWIGSNYVTMRDAGTAPCYNEISGSDGKIIRAHLQHLADVGKTIKIFGIRADTNLPVQEFVDGSWRDGVTLTLAVTPAATTMNLRRITSVIKQRTAGPVFLYEYTSATGLMRDLAMYAPYETHPRYRRSVMSNYCSVPAACNESDGVTYKTVEALVKLQFVPVVSDDDWLFVDNLDALKLGIQAIRLEEANDDESAEGKWIKAIRELNFELRDRSPGAQISVRVNPVGNAIGSPM